jgi:Tat protein translocase TatC
MTSAPTRTDASADAVVEETRMSVGEHLEELRSRLVRSAIALVAAFVVASVYAEDVVRIVVAPFQDVMRDLHLDPTLKGLGPTTGFVTYFKVSLMAALLLAAPVWLHQLWAFVASGLYEREKRPVRKFFPLSVGLFVGGVLFGYFLLLPTALRFLTTFASPDLLQNWVVVSEYLSLFFTLTLLLGVMFELPLVMLGVAKTGIVGSDAFRAKRKIVIVAIFIVAGLATPPDPITQPLVAIPMCLLYELGIAFASAAEGKKRRPLDRRALLKKAKFAAIVALGAALLLKPVISLWRASRADAKAESSSSESGIPWKAAARGALGAEPDYGFRLRESPEEATILTSGGGGVAILRFRPSREKSIAVPSGEGGFDVLAVQAGAVLWRAEPASDVAATEVAEALIEAATDGSEATAGIARALLESAFGVSKALDVDAAAAAAREAAAAYGGRPFLGRSPASRPGSSSSK